MLRTTKRMFIIISFIFLVSCSASKFGPTFQPKSIVPQDKALIYIYWTDGSSMNKSSEFSIYANDDHITTLKYGGYFLYEATPGKLELS